MVLVPFAVSDGAVGFPQTAARDKSWKCPECDSDVVVKRGAVLAPHFAHKSAQNCSGGESLVHRATKEWIAASVKSANFKVVCTCTACHVRFTAFRGGGYTGATEVAITGARRFVIDAVAIDARGRAAAAFEVYHAHKTATVKMKHLAARTYCNAFEIRAVDLVAENYPTEFESIRPLRCRLCLIRAVVRRRDKDEMARARLTRRLGRRWRARVVAIRTQRQLKYWRLWLIRTRWKTTTLRTRALHANDEAKRIQACDNCNGPVELYTWALEGGTWIRKIGTDVWKTNPQSDTGAAFHKTCAPECPTCHEVRTKGKWCACERQVHRRCEDCNKWGHTDTMHTFINPPGSRFQQAWVCDRCGVVCQTCDQTISSAQATFGGKCFTCNRVAKRKRGGVSPTSDYFCECGRKKSPGFVRCYNCHTS